MEENNSNPNHACKQGCGFYGNAQFEGMCSKCYADHLKSMQQNPVANDSSNSSTTSTLTTGRLVTAQKTCHPNNRLSNTSSNSSATNTSSPPAKRRAIHLSESTLSLPESSGKTSENSDSTALPTKDSNKLTTSLIHKKNISTSRLIHIENISSHSAASLPHSQSVPSSLDGEDTCSTTNSSSSSPSGFRKSIRCDFCRKKVGLTGLKCRCDGIFCAAHRYSDKHNCKFDYQSQGQQEIRQNNPQIKANKISKI